MVVGSKYEHSPSTQTHTAALTTGMVTSNKTTFFFQFELYSTLGFDKTPSYLAVLYVVRRAMNEHVGLAKRKIGCL